MRMPKRRPGAPADLEELRPGRFVLHNPAIGPTLRGEGTREGDRFTLTSQRREGLLARLRGRGFSVLSLADQIAALPAPPAITPLGPSHAHTLAAGERVATFTGVPPTWQPAPATTTRPNAVSLCEGQVIRRRKGRGPGAYYLVARDGLRPLSEDAALRHGYALAAHDGPVPLVANPISEGHLLADLPLPAAHQNLLGRIATRQRQGWLVTSADELDLAAALLARLGLELRCEPSSDQDRPA
jgi:hypothetical protein